MRKIILSLIVASAAFTSSLAFGEFWSTTPIGLGVVAPVQFPPADFVIKGLRLSLGWGTNRAVHGIDLGLIGNTTETDFRGLAVSGLFNLNYSRATIIGLQAALGANINRGYTNTYGFQLALANIGEYNNIHGAQIGIYNRADRVHGIQLGLVNSCKNLKGLQIGLANFNGGGPFRVSPLINFGF